MDKQNFRKISEPNLYANYRNFKVKENKFNLPNDVAPDNRYEGWAAQMSDGRLATDYNNHCSKNIPVGEQFPTKAWLQHNGNKIIEFSRNNQFPVTKSLDASVVPPPSQILKTTKYDCTLVPTNNHLGIGFERDNNQTPELFGTFSQTTFQDKSQNSFTTKHFEGGRNTPRGTYSNIHSIYGLNKKNDY
jgi:hypothetical protein